MFTLRGPLRARSDYANDFAAPYTSARLWLQHQNPYDASAFWQTWRTAGAPKGPVYANPSSTHSIYPPPSVVVLSPFALLSWPSAWKTLILLSIILYVTALILLSRLIPPPAYRKPWTTPCQLVFITLGLLLAPAQSALHVSNVTSLSASLLFIALYLLLCPTFRVWAGPRGTSIPPALLATSSWKLLAIAALLTLSICIKPTLAPIVLLYLLYKRLWKILVPTIALTTVITATFQLLQPDWNWLPSLRSNIVFLFTVGVADLSSLNITRSDRIDLQLPAYALTHSRNFAAILAAIISVALVTVLWRRVTHGRVPHDRRSLTAPIVGSVSPKPLAPTTHLDRELLTLSTLLIIGLLPFYQRFYSATLLLLPILWALRNITLPRARWILAVCCVFLVNSSVLPRRLDLHTPPTGLMHLLVEAFIIPHLCWLLLAIAVLLLTQNVCHSDHRE